jgi:hypothetical protein
MRGPPRGDTVPSNTTTTTNHHRSNTTMGIPCTTCGETYGFDELHDLAADEGVTFADARRDFALRGCAVFGPRSGRSCDDRAEANADARDRGAMGAALFDLLGDDVDGIASMFEDAEAMGLI